MPNPIDRVALRTTAPDVTTHGGPTVGPRHDIGAVGPSTVPFRSYLRDLAQASYALDSTVRATLRGAGPSDDMALLTLQARMYQYSEQLDLAGRLVEKATSAVKQTLSANT